ncbi:extracellular solute-binding protein [Scrofimicrobium sp. R131]|uniref:Extracellular solute-binding protein n=1 Tax=Scrofimicrobium appendicitidis TaxID=3079930 RepID=A0AAU7V4X5_9ACTO
MKNRNLGLLAALSVTVGLTLTGCGVSGSSESESGAASGDSAAPVDIMAVEDDQLQGATIRLARFFGDCQETTEGVTDLDKATTECEAIQILTNKFEAENPWGIKVERMGGAAWHSYYDGLNAAMASSDRPDLAVMHGSNLPEYADRGLLVEVPADLGVDPADFTAAASAATEFDGKQYAVPFDSHAIVSHLNMDILNEAGLVDADGTYQMPTSVEELYADAKAVKEKTGKTYLDIALTGDPMGSRFWEAMIYQQGGELINLETGEAEMDSDAAKQALEVINTLAQEGYTDSTHDYDGSVQAFLRGDSAIMYNGSWAVNQFDAEAPFDYQVADAPMLFDQPATWANSHTWVVPVQDSADPVQYRAAFELAKFYNEHTADWAIKTGHMPASQKALESEEYLAAPHRDQYLETAKNYGTLPPRIVQWPAVDAAIQEGIEATWLNGQPIDSTLSDLQARVSGIVSN